MSTFTQEQSSTQNGGYLWPGPYWHWYYNDYYVGYPGTFGHESMALRFPNVTIPAGSTINSAKLSLKVWYAGSYNMYTKIYGIDEDSTAIFPTDQNPGDVPTSRTKTTAAVDWDRGTMPDDEYVDTSDIKDIVTEIIGRGGWASGNAMGFIIDDDGFALYATQIFYNWDRWGSGYAGCFPVLTIDYTAPAHLITKDLKYSVITPHAITKSLKYEIDLITNTPKTFCGVKVAKDGINVLNTNDPRHLKFSSDYNTLKYYWDGTAQIHVQNPVKNEYTVTGYVEHNLGYFPLAMVYAKDDLMGNYQPLGRYQAGSGAYRQFYYYVTTTRLYFVVEGWSMEGDDNYLVDFYFKIFKNNLNL